MRPCRDCLSRIGARTIGGLWKAVGDICGIYSPAEGWNDLKAAGYAAPQCIRVFTRAGAVNAVISPADRPGEGIRRAPNGLFHL